MNIEEILWLERVHGAGAAKPAGAGGAAPDGSSFDKILRNLQSLGETGKTPVAPRAGGNDPGFTDFADAMSRAEDDYQVMMKLRRKLEDAFRNQQHTP